MALPPSPAAAPVDAPPPDMAADGAPDDMAMEDTGGADEVIATICRTADGQFKLYSGDEPEDGAEMPAGGAGEPAGGESAAPEPQTFDTPQAVMRAIMPLLDASTAGADDAFGKGFRGELDTAAKPPMPMAG